MWFGFENDRHLFLDGLKVAERQNRIGQCFKMRPIGIDLFAGAGGLSLGFEQAGFDVKAAIEIDPVHCAVHEFNFPDTKVICQSVKTLTGDEIRRASGIENQTVDCVFGGAPCQGFSLIGQRILDDPRNNLVLDFVRIVKELDAKTFVFENVKGLTLGKHQRFLQELVAAFELAGYQCRLPWKVINAGNYGTPQSRERLFLMGAKKGNPLPQYPEPTTNIAGKKKCIDGLPEGPSTESALGDLPDAETFSSLLKSDSVKTTKFGPPSPYASELRCLSSDAWHFGHPRDWAPDILTSSARTDHTDISRNRFESTAVGTVEPISRLFRLPPDGVSNTLRAGTDGTRGAFTSPRPIHYALARCITVREMARLHGFPDWFRFNVTKWHGARQIGNSVPPTLARAVAGEIISALGVKPTKVSKSIPLGDSDLLSFNISQAALHFNISPPASRRDRKSGAKKRKQVDIERERLAEGI
jgi:DNA (cytosine-5)-methyltransferase 1